MILYHHSPEVHNLKAPAVIVPKIIQLFHPASVLDVGCGIGTWLSVFNEFGVQDYFGIDGDHADEKLLAEYIDLKKFKAFDLSEPFDLNRKFDLVLCLEVAEHLPESAAATFIECLCNHGDTIVFSAAIPGQGGQNHINEQWPDYWAGLFKKHCYPCYDILRATCWNYAEADWWYRQNILVFSKHPLPGFRATDQVLSLIHPAHYQDKLKQIKILKERINFLKNKRESAVSKTASLKNFLKKVLHSIQKKLK